MGLFSWLRAKQNAYVPDAPASVERELDKSLFSTHQSDHDRASFDLAERLRGLRAMAPKIEGGATSAMDSIDGIFGAKAYGSAQPNIPEALAAWYGNQTFIGTQLAGIIAQHWLIYKICSQPGRDATRTGFNITTVDGDDLDPVLSKGLRRADVEFGLVKNIQQWVTFGRIFGIRICLFKVDYGGGKLDDDAYEKPFNIDGVRQGTYKGMVQIDPYWCTPELDGLASGKPDSMHFYEPTWWQINGRRYHRTHLAIFRNGNVMDVLKPAYLYGGIPVPQLIMERVYGAERTANEAPLMALTKRTTVMKTDIAKFVASGDKGIATLARQSQVWNNYGTRLVGTDDEVSQLDTSLSDFDSLIMTQYQLCAAAGNVPSTKLLGTAPKGFNATGEYDESNYHEDLESLQTHDISPFVDRHHALVIASKYPDSKAVVTATTWNPLDTPTKKELSDINKANADADAQLVATGAIDGQDVRKRVANDKTSGYSGIVAPDSVGDPEAFGTPAAPAVSTAPPMPANAPKSPATAATNGAARTTGV